jgi:hypothetical protein
MRLGSGMARCSVAVSCGETGNCCSAIVFSRGYTHNVFSVYARIATLSYCDVLNWVELK